MTDRDRYLTDNALVEIARRDEHIARLRRELRKLNARAASRAVLVRRLREQVRKLGAEPVD